MMSECLEFYQQQADDRLSKKPYLASLQTAARQELMRQGFPTRHVEDWKYTSVDSFLKHRFVTPHLPRSDDTEHVFEEPLTGQQWTISNGAMSRPSSSILPEGVVILPLLEALSAFPEKVTPYLNQILKSEHAFHALNTLMMQLGVFIYVPENVDVSEPIWIRHWQNEANQAVHLHHLVVLERGSVLNLIEDYSGDPSACYFTNTVTEVHLAEKAKLTHYKIQRESKKAFHVGHLAVSQAGSSQFDSHSVSLGGQWVRSDITIDFKAPHAQCLMNGLYLPGEGQHVDHHTLVVHGVGDCQSVQDYKGILSGRSRAVFNGRVMVAQDAQHTHAQQQNKNLLCSTHAEIDTKPQLEIFANDVVCTHGATVGQLDEEALFYLATRGIGREEASRYLMRAFITENCRLIELDAIAIWVGQLLNDQLGWVS